MRRAVLALCSSVFFAVPAYADILKVPDGNRHLEQPEISKFAFSRTKSTRDSFEGKYQKTLEFFRKNPKLVKKIKQISELYDVDPIHMIGAIVGEHTYNVNLLDYMQTYYYKAIEYAGLKISFRYKSIEIDEFLSSPQFSSCSQFKGSYDLWGCREDVWDKEFRGKTVNGTAFPDGFFAQAFFQPFYAGQTFGLGQLSPLAALRLSDTVAKYGGLQSVRETKAAHLYQSIMDPDQSLHYIAALVRVAIEAYRDIAGFDISGNPGLTATLFNLGQVRRRARMLKLENEGRRAANQAHRWPRENFYGWLINDRVSDLRGLL